MAVAIARQFAECGQAVTLVGTNATAANLDGLPVELRVADPSDPASIETACSDIGGRGALDVLVTVPERHFQGGVVAFDAAAIDLATAHLLRAPLLYTRGLVDTLRRASAPAIVHVAPVAAFLFGQDALESALLNALVNYSRQCVPQLPGIRINAACPGGDSTPEQVAALVAFLASERAGYINSAVVTVDGGWYATHPRAMPQ